MKPRSSFAYWIPACIVLSMMAMIPACTISPRRIVGNNSSPSPSPTNTPTPTVTPSPTPTVTPTPIPTGMAAVVPKQFLFTANPDAGLILGFEINGDGGLSSVPGSPFVVADSPRLVAATGDNLFSASETALTLYAVDPQRGALTKQDVVPLSSITSLVAEPSSGTVFANTSQGTVAIRVRNNSLQLTQPAGTSGPAEGGNNSRTSVTETSGRFVYVLDRNTGTITALSAQDRRPLPHIFSAGHGASVLALVVPQKR